MKHLYILLLTVLVLWPLAVPASAKSRLPVTVGCTKNSDTRATLYIKLRGPSVSSLVISVGGTGSVTMERVVRHFTDKSTGREISFPVTFRSGLEAGGLVVEVKGDFGHGLQSQIQTFDLVKMTDSSTREVRSQEQTSEETSPKMIIVPARTTTEAPR
jgi:hypothetical protein